MHSLQYIVLITQVENLLPRSYSQDLQPDSASGDRVCVRHVTEWSGNSACNCVEFWGIRFIFLASTCCG